MMRVSKMSLILINVFGGLAVLGSYAWGFITYPNAGELLWGGVPESLRSLYTGSMFLAAGGYFAFSIFILHLDPKETRILKWPGFKAFNVLFTGILIPSAFWLPLTTSAIEKSSQFLACLTRLDLALVAIASLGLLYAIIKVQPQKTSWLHYLAILGSLFFCFQTVILDAIIWVLNFQI
jgi:hypothetical protein